MHPMTKVARILLRVTARHMTPQELDQVITILETEMSSHGLEPGEMPGDIFAIFKQERSTR